jgi:hypothetical protein
VKADELSCDSSVFFDPNKSDQQLACTVRNLPEFKGRLRCNPGETIMTTTDLREICLDKNLTEVVSDRECKDGICHVKPKSIFSNFLTTISSPENQHLSKVMFETLKKWFWDE